MLTKVPATVKSEHPGGGDSWLKDLGAEVKLIITILRYGTYLLVRNNNMYFFQITVRIDTPPPCRAVGSRGFGSSASEFTGRPGGRVHQLSGKCLTIPVKGEKSRLFFCFFILTMCHFFAIHREQSHSILLHKADTLQSFPCC